MADEPVSAKDLLAKLDKYHDEIVTLARETTTDKQTLRDAVAIVNSQKHTNWSKFKTVVPLIVIVLVIVGILLMRPAGVCQVSVAFNKGLEVTRCE